MAVANLVNVWVSAEIKQGNATLVTSTILTATDEDTFGFLLEKLGSDVQMQSQTIEKVAIAGAGPTVHVVPMSAPIAVVSQRADAIASC